MKILQPPSWKKPRGYSNAVEVVHGKVIYLAGQVGWNHEQKFVALDFVGQVAQALMNIKEILAQAGAEPKHLVRMVWYVKDKSEYLESTAAIGVAYREVLGAHYPAMSLIQVVDLLEDHARVEIEATAVIPE